MDDLKKGEKVTVREGEYRGKEGTIRGVLDPSDNSYRVEIDGHRVWLHSWLLERKALSNGQETVNIFENRVFLDLLSVLERLIPRDRIRSIDDIIHRLSFERRVTTLTRKQKEHMSVLLSGAQRDKLASCKTEEERTEIIEGYARANYIRKCAWDDYLHGVVDEPPIPAV